MLFKLNTAATSMKPSIPLYSFLSLAFLLYSPACSQVPQPVKVMAGVPLELARDRSERISDVRYALSLKIPGSIQAPVTGTEVMRFILKGAEDPVVIDFQNSPAQLLAVEADGGPCEFSFSRGQLTIAPSSLHEGQNSIEIHFEAGDAPLNRRDDLIYTLFVPDRASSVLPCFDQPDLKARFTLTLEIPVSWKTVSNGAVINEVPKSDSKTVQFTPTKPISTYLFAFAAGTFQIEEVEQAGIQMRIFHRESNRDKLDANLPQIVALHQDSLKWLERYTGVAFPFEKFDFVLIPAFQFGGMEHPGAVFYRDTRLLLDESATLSDKLGRATLIAHETAHMWFGDLVTMKWFDDVWLKEVFAGFMASKIVNPAFPDINHDLRFLLEHYPSAYRVERSRGTHPIKQELTNLNESAQLYGDLIYHKAPIVMRQLERLIGEEDFRSGLQKYLVRFEYGNADWLDLISIMDQMTAHDLQHWSRSWVQESGRPTVWIESFPKPRQLFLRQDDPTGKGRRWQQQLTVLFSGSRGDTYLPLELVDSVSALPALEGFDFVLPNSRGFGYGRFHLDPRSLRFLLKGLNGVENDLSRASAWLTLWDGVLESQVPALEFVRLCLSSLHLEKVELISQQILKYLTTTYWQLLSPQERNGISKELETAFWNAVINAPTTSLRSSYFKSFQAIAKTESAVRTLISIWSKERELPGLPLSEQDQMALALSIAIREPDSWKQILREQLERIESAENKARFSFLIPSVSADFQRREAFFRGLLAVDNRRREPWVLQGQSYLHHPLRAPEAVALIRPSLDLLVDISQTGTVFFPKTWLDSTLSGHSSKAAARVVRDFLTSRPDYPKRLREKILKSADLLFRKVPIVSD